MAFFRNKLGQFSILLAVVLTLLMIGLAAAIDMTNLHRVRSKMNEVADAAALAGAAAAGKTPAERLNVVEDFIAANGDKFLPAIISGGPDIAFDDDRGEVTVQIRAKQDLLLPGFVGRKSANIATSSVAVYGQDSIAPLSVAFVLDVSGSMNGLTSDGEIKVQAVKDSFDVLFRAVEAELDNPALLNTSLRTSLSTYNTELQATSVMSWGWERTGRIVDRLTADGGTNSTTALQNAYTQIQADRKFRAANDPNYRHGDLREYVIFMTDGDNNQSAWDDTSFELCLTMREDGINIYSVAFAAPSKGQLLLMDCASWDNLDNDRSARRNNSGPNQCRGNETVDTCRTRFLADKADHYFDASDAKAFKKSFGNIGREIGERTIRIKS